VAIEIEAGLAFGTGHPGTTCRCLLHFDSLLTPPAAGGGRCRLRRGRAGIAAKILKRKVWLGDIDPTAVEVANANARLKGVGALCRAIVSRGVEVSALREGAPYDLGSPTSWRSR
jgi:ribosomal protein L11 methyltransferase